jgi:hypothetical protein
MKVSKLLFLHVGYFNSKEKLLAQIYDLNIKFK